MKILQVVKTGVGATWAVRLLRELVNAGVDVHVAMPEGPRVADYADAGVIVHRVDMALTPSRPDNWPSTRAHIRKLVHDVDPDIVHTHFVTNAMALRLALGRQHPIPRIFQVPGPLHLENALTARAELMTSGSSDYWIATCQWTMRRYLELGIDPSHVRLSYYGSNPDTLVAEAPRLRHILGLGPEVPIVGMVAYMYKPKRWLAQRRGIKGHEDLIDALAEVQRTRPTVQGVFIGGAWAGAAHYENAVRAFGARRLGSSAHFMGSRSDVNALYPDMDLVVHPSHSENLGGAVESCMLRVPTIATDVGGFPDLIETSRTGLLVPPKTPHALARAIEQVLDAPEKAQGWATEAERRARTLCDIRENARQVVDFYGDILGQGSV